MSVILKPDPDWAAAAAALVAGLEAQSGLDGRVAVIDRCRAEMGDEVYPAFLKLLAAIARFGDVNARRITAEALAHALATARLPAARVPAFGGSASHAFGGGLMGNLRSVGPIEFLCIWLERDLARERLDFETFGVALGWLLLLFDAAPEAAALYIARLRAEAEGPVEGLHTRASRRLVGVLTETWSAGETPSAIARRCTDAARAERAADRFGAALR